MCKDRADSTAYPLWALNQKWSKRDTMVSGYNLTTLQTRSQFGEEEHLVMKYFYGMGRGTFLELGALDGLEWGNTAGLDRDLNWKGILIEGSPGSYQKMIKNRPKQLLVNSVICSNISMVHYLDYMSGFKNPAVFGIWEFMPAKYKNAWFPDIAMGKKSLPDTSLVPCVPISMLLNMLRVRHINFFSLDVEGAELEVLKTIDFKRVQFDVICMEGHSSETHQILIDHGYLMVEDIGLNRWYIHHSFRPIEAPAGTPNLKLTRAF